MSSRDTPMSDGPRCPRDIRGRAESLWMYPKLYRDRPDIMPNGLVQVIVYSCSHTVGVQGSHDDKENILRSKRKSQPLHSKGQRYSVACPPDRSPLAKAAGVRALTCPLKDVESHQRRPVRQTCRAAPRGLCRAAPQCLFVYTLSRGILVFSHIRISLVVTWPSNI